MKETKTVVSMKLEMELVLDTDEPVNFLPVGDVITRLLTNRPEIVERLQAAVEEGCGVKAPKGFGLYLGMKRISQRKRVVDMRGNSR